MTPERMWDIFCEAQRTSQHWRSIPRSGHPSKSAWPDFPDEVDHHTRVRLAIQNGESLDDVSGKPPRITPTARQHDMAESIIRMFHAVALADYGDRIRLLRAVAAHVVGVRISKITRATGLTRYRIERAKEQAMQDMAQQFQEAA
jgi:hypothetical protein